MTARPFFLVTAARSASTSTARILAGASNGTCVVEPAPNLNVETRRAMDGALSDTAGVVARLIAPRVRAGLAEHGVYGEKNLTYGPFLGDLHEQCDARFVLLTRNGRDVVRSLIDWHDRMFGTIYRECREPGALSDRARTAAANLPVELDSSDYSRPRPQSGSPLFDRWEDLSRVGMCAYYWAFVNELYLDALAALPANAWTRLDTTSATPREILDVARFLGLEGLTESTIDEMQHARINSLGDRIGEAQRFPGYEGWSATDRAVFDEIAGPVMTRLGYEQ